MKNVPWAVPVPKVTPHPTCRSCHKLLRPRVHYDWPITSAHPKSRSFAGWGREGLGFFCTLRCGFDFGLRMAQQGRT